MHASSRKLPTKEAAMAHRHIAIVQKVYLDGRHGAYAKARSATLGTVTFSLNRDVWEEAETPEEGLWVIFPRGKVVRKRAGWRALKCRFLRPEDPESREATDTTQPTDERKDSHGT